MSDGMWGVGDQANAKAWGRGRYRVKPDSHPEMVDENEFDLIWGDKPHTRNDNRIYARTKNGSIYGFNGHIGLWSVDVQEANYLKSSGFSGDEIRKGGSAKIYLDGGLVRDIFFRDIMRVFREIETFIEQYQDFSFPWHTTELRKELTNRKVYFRDTCAIVKSVSLDGSVNLIPDKEAGVMRFPSPPWARGSDDDEELFADEYSEEMSVDIMSKDIWWFRS